MSRGADWKDILLENARSRGIAVTYDDIRKIRAMSSDSSLAQWVNDTIRLKDLLSLEELYMYEHISQTLRSTDQAKIETS